MTEKSENLYQKYDKKIWKGNANKGAGQCDMFLAQKRGTRFESLSSEPESVWGEALEEGRNVKGDKLRRASESGGKGKLSKLSPGTSSFHNT